MKSIAEISFTCSCGNVHLLAPGSQCDICMGTVRQQKKHDSVKDEWFDLEYFEELEDRFVHEDMAA